LKIDNSILFIVLISVLYYTCQEKPKTDFTSEEKQLFDSLRIIAFKNIRSNTDTACARVKDSLFNIYVDSLLLLRREEIEQLFEK
jgi:hypothetical protein